MLNTFSNPWPQKIPEPWLRQLSERFGKRLLGPELLHQAENSSWLLTDSRGETLILKLYRPTASGLSRIKQEIQLLDRLSKLNFPAPFYLQDLNGQVLQALDEFYATLQPALKGLMWIKAEPSAYEALGTRLNQLHRLSPELSKLSLRRHDFETLLGAQAWQPVIAAPFAPPELKAELSHWREQLRTEFEFKTDTLVHCDAHWGNIIMLEQNKLCLIDWEEAGWGNALLDLATVEIHLQRSPDASLLIKALYRGYGSSPDRRQLNLAMAVRRMWLLSQIPSRLDIPELSDPLSVFKRYQLHLQELLGSG